MTVSEARLWAARLGVFMVPGLALWLPSGYSWGAGLLLLTACASVRAWWGRPLPRGTWWLVVSFMAIAALWLLEADGDWAWRTFDRPSKYLFVVPCLLFLLTCTPRLAWLAMGVAVGGIGAGVMGLYQIDWQHIDRATGYTNAIEYGNLSLLLATLALLGLSLLWSGWRWWQRLLLGAGTVLGVAGSVVSQTRGGWLALLLLLVPACFWLLARSRAVKWAPLWVAACVMGLALLGQNATVQQRVALAWNEGQTYFDQKDMQNSVGYRLDLWRMAWQLGSQRPCCGWGQTGYDAEQARRVQAGELPAAVLSLHHAHNEFLDAFAKRGLPGLALLLVFYGIPLWLFRPAAARVRDGAGRVDRESLVLCLWGVLLPLSYAGFGLTQVFLAHNSGAMFYLFFCAIVFAMLQARRGLVPGVSRV